MNKPAPQHNLLRHGRALHLVDMENLVGTGSPTIEQASRAWTAYLSCVQPGDQVVVACSTHAAKVIWFVIGGSARLLCRRGPDGADLALLGAVDLTHDATRYSWLVVASGDHIFAPLVEQARHLGLRTWQVSGVGASARALTRAAQCHSRLRLASAPATLVARAA